MENTEETTGSVMEVLIFTTVTEFISLLLLIAVLFIALRAAYVLYKTNMIPWAKVMFPCVIASIFVNATYEVSVFYLGLEAPFYVENLLSIFDSVVMLLVTICFAKLVKSTQT